MVCVGAAIIKLPLAIRFIQQDKESVDSTVACISGSGVVLCKPKQAQGAIKGCFCFLVWKNLHFFCISCESLLCGAVIVKEICSSSACHSYRTRKGL